MSTLRVLDKDGNWIDIPTIVGPVGPVGPTGETGPGVSSGGSTGQILRKKSGDDFDTEWVTPTDMDLYYTKEEADDLINSKISTTFKYKGTKASYAAIQAVTNPAVGDVWNDASTDHNYVWNGSTWDKLAGTVDMTNYYTMDEAEAMVDNKLAAVPINDLLHYKGHVDTVEDLPVLGQPSAEELTPILSVGNSIVSRAITSGVISYINSSRGSYKYIIWTGYSNRARAYIKFNDSTVLDGCCPLSTSRIAYHFNASSSKPVIVYNYADLGAILFDDGTTQTISSSAVTLTKPFWTYINNNNTMGSDILYNATNLDFCIKLKFPPLSTSYVSTEYNTFKASSTGRNYIEGYLILQPRGLVAGSLSWFTYYAGAPQASKNDMYSVGSMRELYRCNEKPEWEKWSDFKEFQVTEMTEDAYTELSDKNIFDMYILDRIAEVTETTNLLLNSITGDVDLVEANISEEEALAITNEIIGGVSDE